MKKLSTLFLTIMVSLFSFKAFSIPVLNSFPNATATIFLDFDGYYVNSSLWNGGTPFYCAPSGMTDPQIIEAFNRVAEDYRPFNVNITTDSTVFLAAPLTSRQRIVITPTNGWCPGVGGVSWVGSFTFGDDTPAFVFCNVLGPNSPKMVGECISHESGHTVGLSHQSTYNPGDCLNPANPYNPGTGGGETGWAPIMGNSYYKNMSNWNNGPTPYGCTNLEDNLSIIATQNGFTYRTDDYTQTLNASTYTLPAGSFTVNGIITTNSDEDAFRFVLTRNSNFHLTAIPFNVAANYIGANLDIKLELYNSAGTLIRTYDPIATMSVTVDTILTTGTYYLKIDGTGNINVGNYGSLGAYTISGTSGALPIHDVSLSGNADKGKHNLNWKITADEAIRTIIIETSTNGVNFKPLTSVPGASVKYSYSSYVNQTIFYRLKVTSVLDQTVYSNTIAITGTASTEQAFFVSTLVQSDITVNAPTNYQYVLNDMNGRVISKGSGLKGMNKINISNQQSGMYILQLFKPDQFRQTERIIKQ
jgi:hypothetical protein